MPPSDSLPQLFYIVKLTIRRNLHTWFCSGLQVEPSASKTPQSYFLHIFDPQWITFLTIYWVCWGKKYPSCCLLFFGASTCQPGTLPSESHPQPGTHNPVSTWWHGMPRASTAGTASDSGSEICPHFGRHSTWSCFLFLRPCRHPDRGESFPYVENPGPNNMKERVGIPETYGAVPSTTAEPPMPGQCGTTRTSRPGRNKVKARNFFLKYQ